MGADEDLFRELTERLLASDPGVELKRAFSSPGLRFKDKIFAMHVRGDLVVKVPHERCEELADEGRATPFRIGQRVMREWVVIGFDRGSEWDALADEALAFARRLAAS
jgi:TfoX/Sxy family transcriptional regulator of competence genes